MLEYIQRARHLVSCITAQPVDMATEVHVFISGIPAFLLDPEGSNGTGRGIRGCSARRLQRDGVASVRRLSGFKTRP
ncbi:hypothetical protein PF003_g21051 [Phytophthora fragariae]|nr:hypothetical protein PF003_g21051 [Phytophthora fragariae]